MTADLRAELTRLLLALRYDTPDRCDLLFATEALRRHRPHIPAATRPHDHIRHIVDAFTDPGLPDAPRLLVALLDAARRNAPDRPESARLRALADQLDPRKQAPWGLTRTVQGQMVIRSTELTVQLDRITTTDGPRIRVEYRVAGQPISQIPIASYPAAAAEAPDDDRLVQLLFPAHPTTGDPLDPLAAHTGHPTFGTSLRLRICTTDPALLRLPWWRLRRDDTPLTGGLTPWTIELSPTPRPTAHVELPRVPRVIVIAPDPAWADPLRRMLHIHSTDHRFDNRVTALPSPERLPERLGVRRLPIVLAAGLDAPALDRLRAVLAGRDRDHRPAAVCIVDPPPDHPPGALLAGAAAEVHAPDRAAAHLWMQAALVDGCDPVTAAHCPRLDAPLPVFTAFARWTPGQASTEKLPLPALVLDRIHQRRAVQGQIEALIDRDATHRIEVFVATGPPENRLDELAEQIDEHIAEHLGDLDFDRRPAGFRRALPLADGTRPLPSTAEIKRTLWADLRPALDPEGRVPEDDRAGLLAALARQKLRGVDRVVWLDWGTFGHRRPPLADRELAAWLAWHQSLADLVDPALDLRVASFIALEEPDPARRQDIADAVEDMSLTRRSNAVRYTALPPVDRVPPKELREYIDNQPLSRIDPTWARDLTRALYAATRGGFVPLVEYIHRAWLIGPEELIEELTAPTPRGPR